MSATFESHARRSEVSNRKVLEACYEDPVLFCKTFLSHLFPLDMPWVHRGLLALLTGKFRFLLNYGDLGKIYDNFVVPLNPDEPDGEAEHLFSVFLDGRPLSKAELLDFDQMERPDPAVGVQPFGPFIYRQRAFRIALKKKRRKLIMMPRGSSKTTLAGIAVPVMEIVYQTMPFLLYISEAAQHSEAQLMTIRAELSQNNLITEFFGEQKPAHRDEEKWSGKLMETLHRCAVAATGRGGQVRGRLYRGFRPWKVLFDDLEDSENVQTSAQREKNKRWFYGDLDPVLPKIKEKPELEAPGELIGLATLLHPEALPKVLERDPEWSVVKIGALDRDKEPIWPHYMNAAALEREKARYASAGLLHIYYLEYHNEVRAEETQKFKKDFFLYAAPPLDAELVSAIYIDPAISEKEQADDSVVCVVSLDIKTGLIYIRFMDGGVGWSEKKKCDVFFEQHKAFSCLRAGVESNGYQSSLVQYMREQMFRRNHYFEIEKVMRTGVDKYRYICSVLQGRFANGYMRSVIRFPKLETQLMDLQPLQDIHDDWADALAGAVQMLDDFVAGTMPEEKDPAADEMEPLEKVMGGDWRI